MPSNTVPTHTVASLASEVDGTTLGDETVVILDVTHDSREVGEGVLFVAVPGFTSDGHDFVLQAATGGASAVCVQRNQSVAVPQIRVPDTRLVLAPLAAAVHGHPSAALRVVGITGTNGKTTAAHMLESIASKAGIKTGLIGTIGARSGTRPLVIRRTTPESTDLQRMLAEMVTDDVDVVAMEVSSHALELGRVASTRFAVGAFTNLSQDHLDFHRNMEDYFSAKARLFAQTDHAVVNVESVWGERLAEMVDGPLTTVGSGGDLRATDVASSLAGSSFTISGADLAFPVTLRMAGGFNVSNALVAAGCALVLDISPDAIAAGLSSITSVPGRFEVIDHGRGFGVVVDYAHTPEGIELVIDAARSMSSGRVIAVIGAGGDRDRSKRPLMGAAGAMADVLWVTSDNPRNEDPTAIISDVMEGLTEQSNVRVEPDRAVAIRAAIVQAQPGDIVLILGKGHEQGQDVGGRITPFDDRDVARQALEAGLT